MLQEKGEGSDRDGARDGDDGQEKFLSVEVCDTDAENLDAEELGEDEDHGQASDELEGKVCERVVD